MSKVRVTRARSSRLSETARETAQFGTVFSDHMLIANYENGKWGEPEIVPYGPLPLPPAPISLHYGQAVFEGFRAQRALDGRMALFRPHDNHARLNRSAARLAMPGVTRDSVLTLLRDMDGAIEERPVAIDEVFELRAAGRLSEAAGVGTAATIVPIGRVRYRDQEIDLTPVGSDSILERVRVRLEAIRTGREADRHGWLMYL